jgi:predicted secreted protein
MNWKTVLAIYLLFWIMSAFLILPFEARAARDQQAELVAGQEKGAPASWRPARVIGRTTILSAILFGLFYANYIEGWITLEMLGITR